MKLIFIKKRDPTFFINSFFLFYKLYKRIKCKVYYYKVYYKLIFKIKLFYKVIINTFFIILFLEIR